MRKSFAILVAAVTLLVTAPAIAQSLDSSPVPDISAGLEQLRHVEGDWAVTTEFVNEDGSIAASHEGMYSFRWVIPDAVLSGTNHIPTLDQTSAILFYLRPKSNEIEMVSVGKDGMLWIMTGKDGEEERTTRDVPTQDGGSMRLRFTRYNVSENSFESRMDWSTDGGKNWTQGNHQVFRRCSIDSVVCSEEASVSSNPSGTIDHEIEVNCNKARAFQMWTDPETLAAFLGPVTRIEARVGGAYELAFFPDDDPDGSKYGTKGAKILKLDPPDRLVFQWIVFSADSEKGGAAPPANANLHRQMPTSTWVQVDFVSLQDNHSRVRLQHLGFGNGAEWDDAQRWFDPVWANVLDRFQSKCALNQK